MIVLDASVVVELLLQTPIGRAVAARLADPTDHAHAPELMDVEVLHVLRRHDMAGTVPRARCAMASRDLADLGVERWSHGPLLGRVWVLRHNLSAYDATYVALAEALDAPLLTLDRRLAQAAGHSATVAVVGL